MNSFRRKLFALSYANWETFNYADETEWRNFVVWLENQKLRNYKIEERAALCKIDSLEWPEAFRKYLGDLDCDLDDEALASRLTVCDWLLNQAMHFEFSDELLKQPAEAAAVSVGDVEMSDVIAKPKESANPLDYLDFDSDEFRARTRKLCELLQIAPYSDPKEELKAACLLITERLNSANIERFKVEYGKVKVGLLPLEQVQATLAEITREAEAPAQDSITDDVSRILRVLHVSELRTLQTAINDAIVAMQKITANPKTDESLGKVGR